jgi:hypothetical protein
MPASLIENDSLLAIDVGTATTRALLFDVVEGSYRFIASGQAPTTAEAPMKDVGEGVRMAIETLQTVTGQNLLDTDGRLIMPVQPDGQGVDSVAATISAGPALRTVIVGLLEEVSLTSARQLAETTYTSIVETLDMNDRRPQDEQIDSVIRARPDLVIITGGTDEGASNSVQKALEAIGLTCYLMPAEKRPAVLFAGNQELTEDVRSSLGKLAGKLRFSPNVRPSLDTEDLSPASKTLAELVPDIRKEQLKGVGELDSWSGGHLLPSAYGMGRIIRFLSQMYSKGILGVDVGASATVVAAGFTGEHSVSVYPQFGVGEHVAGLLRYISLEHIMRWLLLDIAPDKVRDYLYQQALYPTSIPATKEDLAISQALAREVLRLSLKAATSSFPPNEKSLRHDLLPVFEMILAGGSPITSAPTFGQSLLLLLDAIQPVGVSTVVLDQNNLLSLLGVAAEKNNLIPVQVLESNAFVNLATVVSPIASASYGAPVVRARLIPDSGNEVKVDVKHGNLEILPLPANQMAQLALQPARRVDIGFGPGRSGAMRVVGGVLGVVIDARGRPLVLPEDPTRRRELIKKWLWTVGG